MTMLAMMAMTVGAQGFDNLPDPIEDVNKVVDNTPDSIAKALMSRPKPGSTRVGSNPVLFLVGNSTMRNGTRGDGSNGQWGWGYYFPKYFDAKRMTVENQALGGMSTRTFYTDLWPAVRDALKPGDWVIAITTTASSSTRSAPEPSFPASTPTPAMWASTSARSARTPSIRTAPICAAISKRRGHVGPIPS